MKVDMVGAAATYDGRDVLSDVNLTIAGPGTVAVIGPNGAGKTTLLRLIVGLRKPTRGDVTVSGDDEASGPGRAAAFVEQNPVEHPWMPARARDVMDVAQFPTTGAWRRPSRARRDDMAAAAEQLGVSDLLDRRFADLSGGQRQRVRLAAALASDAPILVLDEPATGLDPTGQSVVREALRDCAAAGRLVIASTHDLDDAWTADRVLVVAGTVVADGPPDAVIVPHVLDPVYGAKVEARDGRVVRIHDEHGGHGGHSGH